MKCNQIVGIFVLKKNTSPVEQRSAKWSYQPGGNLPGTMSQHLAAVLDPESGPELEKGLRRCPRLLFVVVERWSTHSRHPPDRRPCTELCLAQWDRTKLHKHRHGLQSGIQHDNSHICQYVSHRFPIPIFLFFY